MKKILRTTLIERRLARAQKRLLERRSKRHWNKIIVLRRTTGMKKSYNSFDDRESAQVQFDRLMNKHFMPEERKTLTADLQATGKSAKQRRANAQKKIFARIGMQEIVVPFLSPILENFIGKIFK